MDHVINDYRKANGKEIIWAWDGLVSHFCKEHCWAMAREGHIYHAADYYLGPWKEAVLECSYNGEHIRDLARKIMFEWINSSEGHRDIVLNSEDLAFAYIIHDWKLYLCIRGK
jgi:hypothetical protein